MIDQHVEAKLLEPTSVDSPLPWPALFLLSLAFWGVLFTALGMYAVVVLAPSIVEQTSLLRQQESLDVEIANLTAEIEHFEKVSRAIESDSEFVARLAGNEFALAPRGSMQVHVSSDLGYDARIPNAVKREASFAAPWHYHFLLKLSSPTGFQRKWWTAALGLFLFAFFCLNEVFFSGRLGHGILHFLAILCQRYRVSTTIPE